MDSHIVLLIICSVFLGILCVPAAIRYARSRWAVNLLLLIIGSILGIVGAILTRNQPNTGLILREVSYGLFLAIAVILLIITVSYTFYTPYKRVNSSLWIAGFCSALILVKSISRLVNLLTTGTPSSTNDPVEGLRMLTSYMNDFPAFIICDPLMEWLTTNVLLSVNLKEHFVHPVEKADILQQV
ncbi:hypothetical protein K493DRAFT_299137 [Basidiobolus meristosporus CBS 931.73]|uniref:Uncharacterized protein n=1 Tax=Basidiobolus meristosporus CBS 931.73 TaxID=1314790 RepID=A0A1Y1YPJ5_9FUNG|nr:hypothetical protein K493DRAFT_299137 [Basidiobolus meristosporus CBS 931.73]|eukprot:ORX99939.1 hypothetical protein K493DRAFT_299137 [Basidiobolus meristosporus CBS 931.73]